MDVIYHAGKTELARNTRKIIREAQRGQTVFIEHHGQPEVAILDIADYFLLRALANYHANSLQIDFGNQIDEERVNSLPSLQEVYDLVLGYYLEDKISLSRAAELLGSTWLDLRTRFVRLNIPLRAAPTDMDELAADIETINELSDKR